MDDQRAFWSWGVDSEDIPMHIRMSQEAGL
jgi:hypothetical protein